VAILRIRQAGQSAEVSFDKDGLPQSVVTRQFVFAMSAQDAEDIRWYLEDYRIYPMDPAPRFANRIEQRMRELGQELFELVLSGTDAWTGAQQHLEETRIEVETDLSGSTVPWELLRDPQADLPLALYVPSFVRIHSNAALIPATAVRTNKRIRILLAICRPAGEDDVPFRSVAKHLIRGLGGVSASERFELEVLRPPSFEQLGKKLRAAKASGQPFHVFHFDGHGRDGAVFFENAALEGNTQLIAASELGKLLKETGVPVLVLNACRSAHAEPLQQPEAQSASDAHRQIRSFGSLAHAVMDYGASSVVAWRYNVFVDTAAQFMADLYAALVSGSSVGEAATFARKQLSATLEGAADWTIPLVFESKPVHLFPAANEPFKIHLNLGISPDSRMPRAPDVGFIGRDGTILSLDRMFDVNPIVLLHAYAGSGKTSTAAEFAGWYEQTRGLDRSPIFTSFEHHLTLGQVLNELSRPFEDHLKSNRIEWFALEDSQKHAIAMQLLRQFPVLWIWDNIEPITGFPARAASHWTVEEQNELANFLRDVSATKAKLLLTSRRDERAWLHALPARVELPPLRFEESVEMARALVLKYGRRALKTWRTGHHS
jgi:hypothetical protein